MAHYRKIDVQIWNDARIAELRPAAKLAFVFLITHPNMTSLGAMRATIQGLAAELGVSPKDFAEVITKGLAKFDEKALCIFLPNFLKYQGAESPNVIKNWVKQIAYIPECDLKRQAVAALHAYVEAKPEGFQKAFREAFHKAFGEEYSNTVSSKQLAVKLLAFPSHEGGGLTSDVGIEVDPRTGEIRGALQ